MLDNLPKELLSQITEHLYDKADLKSLSQVSKSLYQHTIRQLYRSVTIRAIDEHHLDNLGLSILDRSAQHLRYIEDLQIEAPFHDRLHSRCPDDEDDDVSESDLVADETGNDHETFLRALESQLNPLLRCLPEGGLQSFSWNLGTCIPGSIVDYLSNKQTQITSLTITTDISCSGPASNILRLGGFDRLQRISWTTFGAAKLQTLGTIFLHNSAHLQEIRIDCGGRETQDRRGINRFATDVLRTEPGSRSELFPKLQRLTLFGVCLQYGVEDIMSAFRIPRLQVLKLQDCAHTNQLLDLLAQAPQASRLTSLEVNFTGHFVDQYDPPPLIKFLRSFRGLEDLFLLYPKGRGSGLEFWNAVHHHHKTLERIVLQLSDSHGSTDGRDDRIDEFIGRLGGYERLRCLRICCEPEILSALLANVHPRPGLRLLYIRPRGWITTASMSEESNYRHHPELSDALPNVEGFARWAFGPDGLPDLEILAYGDFSFRGRRPIILFCRSEGGEVYRELTKEDMRLWEMVQDNDDFLESCPEDYLMHQW